MGKKFEEIQVGDTAEFSKKVTMDDLQKFAAATGDYNEIHVNKTAGKNSRFGKCIAHGALVVGMFGTVLGIGYVGQGAVYLSQTVKFRAPVMVDDEITAQLEVLEKLSSNRVRFRTFAENQNGTVVAEGESVVMVPN